MALGKSVKSFSFPFTIFKVCLTISTFQSELSRALGKLINTWQLLCMSLKKSIKYQLLSECQGLLVPVVLVIWHADLWQHHVSFLIPPLGIVLGIIQWVFQVTNGTFVFRFSVKYTFFQNSTPVPRAQTNHCIVSLCDTSYYFVAPHAVPFPFQT